MKFFKNGGNSCSSCEANGVKEIRVSAILWQPEVSPSQCVSCPALDPSNSTTVPPATASAHSNSNFTGVRSSRSSCGGHATQSHLRALFCQPPPLTTAPRVKGPASAPTQGHRNKHPNRRQMGLTASISTWRQAR